MVSSYNMMLTIIEVKRLWQNVLNKLTISTIVVTTILLSANGVLDVKKKN
jgi:hypothetical protein